MLHRAMDNAVIGRVRRRVVGDAGDLQLHILRDGSAVMMLLAVCSWWLMACGTLVD
jgi:hypothetical protein